MSQVIATNCKACNAKISLKYSYLKQKQEEGLKGVNIACKSCNVGNTIPLTIQWLNEHLVAARKELKTDNEPRTQILDKDSNFIEKLLRLKVESFRETPAQFIGLKEGENLINRFTLNSGDLTISKNHAKLNVINFNGRYRYSISDLGSTNGTYFNNTNQKIEPDEEIIIKPGDKIFINKTPIWLAE